MTKTELFDLIKNGEDSMVEFKRDDVQNHDLAKALVAFLNLQGGTILLGVDDDGSIRGTNRDHLEEWVAELSRKKIEPPIIPIFAWIKDIEPGKHILTVRVPVGPDKPYARLHDDRKTYFVRVGKTSREASREELERLFQASGRIQYGLKPVPGTSLADLDVRRIKDYFTRLLKTPCPADADTLVWGHDLNNMELMTATDDVFIATVDGVLLFGANPKRFLPQSGIRAIAYPGEKPDYAAQADEELRGPMTPLCAADGRILEAGLVEQALDFIRRNTRTTAVLDGGRMVDKPDYPGEVLREIIVNALVHRDYSIFGTDIALTIFSNRLEIQSPGRLPNTATVEALKFGFRYARNQTVVNLMRDYGYVEFRGMGIRDKVIPGMLKHNGTEPEFIVNDHSFTVRLWKERIR